MQAIASQSSLENTSFLARKLSAYLKPAFLNASRNSSASVLNSYNPYSPLTINSLLLFSRLSINSSIETKPVSVCSISLYILDYHRLHEE